MCRHSQTGSKILVDNFVDNHCIEASRTWFLPRTEMFVEWVFPSGSPHSSVNVYILHPSVTCRQCLLVQTSNQSALHTEDRHRLSRGSLGTNWPLLSSPQHPDSRLWRMRLLGTQNQRDFSASPPAPPGTSRTWRRSSSVGSGGRGATLWGRRGRPPPCHSYGTARSLSWCFLSSPPTGGVRWQPGWLSCS